MTISNLTALLERGETLDVEFKGESTSHLSDSALVENVVWLANRIHSGPGYLLVGVEDDGEVTGARPRHEGGRTDVARVCALIANRTRPSVAVRAELVPYNGVEVLVIEVPFSPTPVGTSDGKYLRRALGGDGRPACVPLAFHEMQSRQASLGSMDHTALALPGIGLDVLDPLEFERFRRSVRESGGRGDDSLLQLDDLELARVLGAVEGGDSVVVRVLGLLLFGRVDAIRTHLPTHEIAFQVLNGLRVEANEFFRLPMLRALDELDSRFRARCGEEEVEFGLVRVAIPDYPHRAFREAISNACVHRDYSRLGAIHVQWHEDRIEVSSPGGFPEGVRLDNLLVTPPRPRNPLLADALKRAGVVERTARGIDTIFEAQLQNGRPAPSYGRSTDASVVLVLPGGQANLQFARFVLEEERGGRPLGLDGLLLLNHLHHERSLATADVARLTQKSDSEARAQLHRMIEHGLVEARGEGKGRTYHLSARAYQRLGQEVAYTRQRGFDRIQQEQMVLSFVAQHGRITRNQAAELCGLAPGQAYLLLAKLRDDNKLTMHGSRRGSWYGPEG